MKTRVLQRVPSGLLAAFAAVFALGGGTAQAAACTVPGNHATIQAAVNDPSCDPINVAPGAYPENVTIPRTLTLNGAQMGNAFAGRTFGSPFESTVAGLITVQAAHVTIDGFSLTNPGQNFGILIKTAGDDAVITNNIIDTVGAASLTTNPAAIYLERGPDRVGVVGNRITNVQSVPTAQGILVGDSTSPDPSLNILIRENSIEDITSGMRGAYGIQVNNGASAAPTATGFTTVAILGNTITRLTGGGWAHAIGLEGDTPGVVVEGNSISNVVDLTPAIDGQDAVAVHFEANPSFPTAEVHLNNFDVTILAYGIRLHPSLIASDGHRGNVDGTCNWWDDASGPGPVGPGLGARVSSNVDFTPWLIAPAPAGACVGGVSAPGKVTGGGQIESDPVFSFFGDLLSVPALIPSLADPNAQATFGFVAKCCAPTGNLEYNDHQANVRIKAQSIDGLDIRSPGDSCPATPGSKHATIGGTATVIRPTGTDTEDFTVEVDDCGEPGTADTFGIKTTTYSNGWPVPSPLIGGNIRIHK
jgi:hypothetical protein